MSENKIYGQGKCCKCGKNISTSDVTKKKCNKCHVEEIKNHFNIPTEEEITRLTAEVERLDAALDRAVELIAENLDCPPLESSAKCGLSKYAACDDGASDSSGQTIAYVCWRDYLTKEPKDETT